MTNGWRLTGLLTLLLAAMCLSFLIPHGWDVEGLRLVIRATARTSLVLFVLAFTASAMVELMPSEATRWLRRNRRYLGVSFAVSHAFHLVALVALARMDAELFWKLTNIVNIVLAGTAYVLLAAMTATSFDRAVVWLGARRWRLLHLIGGWYIWISFAVSIGKRVPQGPIYWAMLTIVLAAGVARLVAVQLRNRRQAALNTP